MKILNPGHNCWRTDTAERVTFLVDGADYFKVLRATAMRAELSLLILAWDTYSNLRLIRMAKRFIQMS